MLISNGYKRKKSLSGVPYIPWQSMKFERLTLKRNGQNENLAKCLLSNEVLHIHLKNLPI